MNRFLGLIARDIEDHQLLADGQTILVAVSGGVDSVVLLDTLHRLSKRHRWKLVVAHFNHQLRGRESDRDERFVRALAARLGWPYVVDREPVAKRAKTKDISIEMAARTARHAFLARAASEFGAHVVALAHHADDQAELFLLRLLRGSGSEGLGGMKWAGPSSADPQVRLIRPLLGRTRAEIEAFAKAWKLAFREDASNASVDIPRNRIRRELIPLLREHYQPAVIPVLNRQAELLGGEAEYLAAEARRWLKQRPSRQRPFAQLPLALQRRVVVEQLLARGVAPEFATVEAHRTRSSARLGSNHAVSSSGTGTAQRETVVIDLQKEPAHGRAELGNYRVYWRIRTGRAPNLRQPRPGREWVDADKLGGRIGLRMAQSGDRFQPLGMPGPARLQNLFVNARIPRERRAYQLLATDASGAIWWVAELRLGAVARVDARTRRFLEWKWELK